MNKLPIWFERGEGALIFLGATGLFAALGESWWWYILLFFIFDVSFVGYLVNTRFGAIAYNFIHSLILPLLLLALSLLSQDLFFLASFSLIWLAHIGFDRMLGYGLKYPDNFHHTLYGWIGRGRGQT